MVMMGNEVSLLANFSLFPDNYTMGAATRAGPGGWEGPGAKSEPMALSNAHGPFDQIADIGWLVR